MSCIITLPDWMSLGLKEWVVCLLTMYMSSIASTGPQLPDRAVFPQASIPQDFIEQLYICASMFKDLQVSARVVSINYFFSCVRCLTVLFLVPFMGCQFLSHVACVGPDPYDPLTQH
jgi:hypothetical protein